MADKKEQKVDFGEYAIVDPIEYQFKKAPEKWWRIKPVTSGMELDRAKYMMHNRVVETFDGVRHEQPPTAMEVAYREIALTFGGTNIMLDDGPILEEDAAPLEVENVLRTFPQEMVNEIWIEIGRNFPKWGPADPNSL